MTRQLQSEHSRAEQGAGSRGHRCSQKLSTGGVTSERRDASEQQEKKGGSGEEVAGQGACTANRIYSCAVVFLGRSAPLWTGYGTSAWLEIIAR